jgi:apolipoprotein N-acyltransferase
VIGRFRKLDLAMRRSSSYSLAASSGILLALSFPPFDLSFFAWIALVPLLLATIRTRGNSFVLGLITGIVLRILSIYWIASMLHGYARATWPVSLGAFGLLVLYLSTYTGFFTWSVRRMTDRHGFGAILTAPFLWAAFEYANEHLFTGFHWLPLAASQTSHLRLIQAAEFGGTCSVSFLIVLVNAALTLLVMLFLRNPDARVPIGTAVAAGVAAGIFLACSWFWGGGRIAELEKEASHGRTLRVRLVNPAVPQDVKWTLPYRAEAVKAMAALSRSGSGKVDLVIWPEAAVPFYFEKDPFLSGGIYDLSTELKTPILFGAPGQGLSKGAVIFTNSAFLVGPGRKLLGRYDKRSLVPFGEYVPQGRLLSFVPPVARGLAYAALTPGDHPKPLRVANVTLGVLICYETIFKALVQESSREGVSVLVNLSNDAWLGEAGGLQHFAMARFSAIEARRPVVRVANRGTSAVFDSSGRARCVMKPEPAGSRDCVVGISAGVP